jgi:NADH-quinone oxidoreductase subunit G
MPTVYINDIPVEIDDHERLNGIQAARRAGVEIPHYCWHAGLSVVASCRMCLVETGTKDKDTGEVKLLPKLVPACQTPAREGTVFFTNSQKVDQARAMVEEDLLIDHPIDCPICDKAGECYLQDYHFKYGQDKRRADIKPFTSRRRPMGDTVTLFVDRCVMCSRCVRFCREVSGTNELLVINRGAHEEIDVFPGYPLANKLSGNVVDICPVGALGDRKFLYSQRVWFMKDHPGICTRCSTGCNVHIDENQDRIYRLRPRVNLDVNQWWMCDEGRYGWDHVHAKNRIIGPRRLDPVSGEYRLADWTRLPDELNAALRRAADGGAMAAVLSPHLTVEEAYLLANFARSIDSDARIAVGPVQVHGDDEKFKSGFTIHAEKCPNRLGVEKVAAHFMGQSYRWDDLLDDVRGGTIAAAWVTAAYPDGDWIDDETADTFESLACLVTQDLFASPLLDRSHFQLPAAAFAERDGSYVNCDLRLQYAPWAIRPPAGVQVEGRLLWRLRGRQGMYDARSVLAEMTAEIPYFAAASDGVPPGGLDLRVTQIAERKQRELAAV